jgi:hypothetical protein
MRSLLLVALVLFALAPREIQASPVAQSCLPLADGGAGITISGPAGMNSQPFDLAAGNYVVRWQANSGGPITARNVILHVKRADGAYFAGSGALVNRVLDPAPSSLSGETYLYGVKAGTHYVDVLAPGEWTVSLLPL